MKFWLSKNSEISLREQLARQIVLAIVGGDLRAGNKLPSVREMALRHEIHPNTVSAAYVWLETDGWVESRKGSGVFVAEKSAREIESAASNSEAELDSLISQFMQTARLRGFAFEQITSRLSARLEQTKIKQILLVEPDPELRKILFCEIQNKTNLPIAEIDLPNLAVLPGAIVLALEETACKLPSVVRYIRLQLNSVQNEMRGKTRPHPGELVGVVSRLETFLRWSKTMLVAAGIAHEQIVLRDARTENWQRGLSSCVFVIADSLTARELPPNLDVRVFRLIAEKSLNELQTLIG